MRTSAGRGTPPNAPAPLVEALELEIAVGIAAGFRDLLPTPIQADAGAFDALGDAADRATGTSDDPKIPASSPAVANAVASFRFAAI